MDELVQPVDHLLALLGRRSHGGHPAAAVTLGQRLAIVERDSILSTLLVIVVCQLQVTDG